MFVMTATTSIATDWSSLIQIGLSIVGAASAIAAVTPTPRDDGAIGRLYKVLELLALNVGRAKDTPPNRLPR